METDRIMARLLKRKTTALLTRGALIAVLGTSMVLSPISAFGVSEQTQNRLDQARKEVEQATEALSTAQSRLAEIQQNVTANQEEIDKIEAALPQQQEKAASAMRTLYKYQTGNNTIMSVVLQTTSLDDVITTIAYLNQIQDSKNREVQRLADMESELQARKDQLTSDLRRAESEQQKASDALARAQKLRSDAQKKAEQEAAEDLKRLAAETGPASGQGADGDNSHNTANNAGQTINIAVTPGAVDWNVTKDQFLATWTPRLDAYLAGSPLAGTGSSFALAAWNSSVDPRWSAAIACIESSKGLYCFKPFNAWGWLTSKNFSSWDESIQAHADLLGSVYGPTLTPAAAQKYCPPTWQDWYNKVASEMNRI